MKAALKEKAVARISVSYNISKADAESEFNGMVNWYLRGTGRTFSDIQYAVECAACDVLDGD